MPCSFLNKYNLPGIFKNHNHMKNVYYFPNVLTVLVLEYDQLLTEYGEVAKSEAKRVKGQAAKSTTSC